MTRQDGTGGASPQAQVPLRFAEPAVDADTHVNLSAVRSDGRCLWIAGDETATVERLTKTGGTYDDHVTFSLAEVLDLPGGPEDEVDVEGLARRGPYLWAVGSHSRRRKQIKDKHDDDKAVRRLAKVSDEPSRHVVARLAIAPGPDGLPTVVGECGAHTSAILPGGIRAVLQDDEHLAPFLTIPGKDNGLDIEGVAVHGDSLYLGLRGPVLRGWAVVLTVRPRDGDRPGRLALAPVDDPDGDPADGPVYRKHFLDLDGLGVRDLCPDGDDLLVLTGPSMDLDGPVRVYRWPDALRGDLPQVVRRKVLTRILDLPYGEGDDHAEGIALLPGRRLLVVYDSPAPPRLVDSRTVLGDVFDL